MASWKKELLDVCKELREQCKSAIPGPHHLSKSKQIESTPFTVMVTYQGMKLQGRGMYLRPSFCFSLIEKGIYHIGCDSQAHFVEVASRYLYRATQPERELQSSKHCDAGYMNDVRFGDQS